jgi:hypothetical protein
VSRAEPNRLPPALFSVELCARCRRETLPKRKRSSIVRDSLRAPAKGMTKKPTPADLRAERVRSRKEKKRSLRSLTREVGILGAIKLSLDGRQLRAIVPISENCQRCLKRRKRIA